MCATEWEKEPFGDYDIYQYWLIFGGQINEEFLPQSKYRKYGLPTIEKYAEWNEAEDFCNAEVLIPVKIQ